MSYELSKFEFVRQCISLSVALAGVVAHHNTQLLLPAAHYINAYAIIDIFFVKTPDMFIHHLLVISCVCVMVMYDIDEAYKLHFMNQLMKFEYSSIFYSGGPLVFHYLSRRPELAKKVKIVFHMLFAVTFIKYRVLEYSLNVVFFREIYDSDKFQNYPAFVQLMITAWIFYALNLYWTRLIVLRLVQ